MNRFVKLTLAAAVLLTSVQPALSSDKHHRARAQYNADAEYARTEAMVRGDRIARPDTHSRSGTYLGYRTQGLHNPDVYRQERRAVKQH